MKKMLRSYGYFISSYFYIIDTQSLLGSVL